MQKLLLILLFIVSSQLFAEDDFSELEIAETISESEYQKIIEHSLSDINEEYFTIEKENPSEKIEENLTLDVGLPFEEQKSPIFSSYTEAVVKAKEEDKMILLEIVLDNCKFCDKMETLVLSKKSVQETISKNFILAQINADQEPLPLGLSEQMSPMFVFISKDENVQDMRFGYINENDFLNLLVEQSAK